MKHDTGYDENRGKKASFNLRMIIFRMEINERVRLIQDDGCISIDIRSCLILALHAHFSALAVHGFKQIHIKIKLVHPLETLRSMQLRNYAIRFRHRASLIIIISLVLPVSASLRVCVCVCVCESRPRCC